MEWNVQVELVTNIDLGLFLEDSWEENLWFFNIGSTADWANLSETRVTGRVLGSESQHEVLTNIQSLDNDIGIGCWDEWARDQGLLPAIINDGEWIWGDEATFASLEVDFITVDTSGTNFFWEIPLELDGTISACAGLKSGNIAWW